MKKIITIALAALTVSASVLCGCGSNNTASSGAPADSSAASEAATTQPVTDSPVKATGGKIHITDNTLGDIWITELEGVPVNKLQADGFTADNWSTRVQRGN